MRSSRGGPREIEPGEPVRLDARQRHHADERRRGVRAHARQAGDVDLARALVALDVALGDPALRIREREEQHGRRRHGHDRPRRPR